MSADDRQERRDNVPRRAEDVPFKNYVDAKVEPYVDRMRAGDITLREFVEAMFQDIRRAVGVASEEREKAASALRVELARAIEEGDRNLRDHIIAQVEQIRAALVAADALEVQRYTALEAKLDATRREGEMRLDAMRRELGLINDAAARAIEKAERSNEKRFEAFDEIRKTLTDQNVTFLPREVAETQYAELRRSVHNLADEYRRAIADINQRLGKIT